ncbi:PLP-dependent transferase [Aspergillus steynii IBT 23096]|uniref:PLP-dependent transferase n=1 Tax=Aspergillus steynii IBT 23096 TaxID=1392250 RepID=A0A2I2GM93_9EURO|nr:PLP-dependent transferase [Aspergillus steynii IBT 23096]PLB54002.1 PLP-dependent transferase [Aspergillus steynii IBT 23096]
MHSNADLADQERVLHSTAIEHHISRRGAVNFAHRDVWGPREKAMGDPWSPNNPNGTVILRLAENSLMHEEVGDYICAQVVLHLKLQAESLIPSIQTKVLPVDHLTYSTGPRGSRRLRRAAAALLTEQFHARSLITYDNILVTPGVASAIDGIAFAICDEGDGVLVLQPLYNGFKFDMQNRANVQIVGVKFEGVEGFGGLDDLFRPEVNRKALEIALQQARKAGINIRALLISNPHNPLGRCYPPETLKEFASFCGQHNMHLISDEIYAFSVFANPEIPSAPNFTSILTLDLDKIIDPSHKHVLYGASKDFCANGLRLGFIFTKNEGIIGAMSSIGIFSWLPHLLQDAWAAMLEDKQWMERFMEQKRQLMLDRYEMTTAFLSKHDIPYYEMNAGLFIWVDLRHLLVARSQEPDRGALVRSSPDAQLSLQLELRFTEICMENGVMIAPGHVYMSESYGWFRITFTVGKKALEEGLRRFLASIKKMKAECQLSKST